MITSPRDESARLPEVVWSGSDEQSMFALGTTLLRHRWRIVRWTLAFGVLTALLVAFKPPLYRASASFLPQGTDASRSGLASLAGQFGVSLPMGAQSTTLTPDFYVRLIKSRELLTALARDSVRVAAGDDKRTAVLDILEIKEPNARAREEKGVKLLQDLLVASVSKTTGVVELSAATRWPTVSLSIVSRLVDGVNEFNVRTKQGQAAAERKFTQARLQLAATDLRAAEDRLANFLEKNRQLNGSPELSFQRDRLQRVVSLQQQVFTSLTQSFEEVRIREVRDTPVITMVDSPAVSVAPEPRGRVTRVLLGLVVGVLFGAGIAVVSDTVARRRAEGDAQTMAFLAALGEVKGSGRRRDAGRAGQIPS